MSNKTSSKINNIFEDTKSLAEYIVQRHHNQDYDMNHNIFKDWLDVETVLKYYYGSNKFSKYKPKLRKLFITSYVKFSNL